MRSLRKALGSFVASVVACASLMAVTPAVSAEQMTFLKGDVDGSGSVNLSDVTQISRFLSGNIGATAEEITRMDAVTNKVIEKQDYNWILDYTTGDVNTNSITVEKYASLLDETRTYCVYDCDLGTETSTYTLNSNNATSNMNTRIFETYDDYRDTENVNTVKIVSSRPTEDGTVFYLGSGFTVANNVVATAAHCVYGEDGYAQNLKVEVYDRGGTILLDTYEADYIHIPQLYKNNDDLLYDYALIKVKNNEDDEDLSRYGIWSLGCVTNEFISTGSDVIVSGFTGSSPNADFAARYYSCGPILNVHSNEFFLYTEAKSYGGKSGGPMYYESVYDGNTVKSVIGITSHIFTDSNGVPIDNSRSRCVRITPTLLKFFLNNSNI